MSSGVLRCQACRASVLDAFVALAAPVATGPHIRPRITPPTRPSKARRLSSSNAPRQELDSHRLPRPDTSLLTTSSPASDNATLPWYLQIPNPPPPRPISPIQARQEIPPLPVNPPPLLHPMLLHLSDSIGLDNLTLLDLRHLNPPAALGANLLMILGTARSTKHLNVSADRFCRWLRSTYKLRPYADGLLGRNELKIKLRRKAKRMKLAQSVGSSSFYGAESGYDDGITTGWVCVNVGTVGDAVVPGPQQQQDDLDASTEEVDDEYENPEDPDHHDTHHAGFGTRDASPRIVVQMFTEEKRLEMDLEGLWDARNTKRTEKADRAQAAAEDSIRQQQLQMEAEPLPQFVNLNLNLNPKRADGKPDDDDDDDLGMREIEREANVETETPVLPEEEEDVGAEEKKEQMEKEIDDEKEREGMPEERPMGGIGAS